MAHATCTYHSRKFMKRARLPVKGGHVEIRRACLHPQDLPLHRYTVGGPACPSLSRNCATAASRALAEGAA